MFYYTSLILPSSCLGGDVKGRVVFDRAAFAKCDENDA